MRQCKCGAALDYAPDSLTACWECRDKTDKTLDQDVILDAVNAQIAKKCEMPLLRDYIQAFPALSVFTDWICVKCFRTLPVEALWVDLTHNKVVCTQCRPK